MIKKFNFKEKITVLFFTLAIFSCVFAQEDQGTWIQKINFGGTARANAISFSIGTKGYFGAGGSNSVDHAMDFWEYDQQSETWTQKANIGNTVRLYGVGFSIGNKGYVGLGRAYSQSTNDFWEYDPQNNIWVQKNSYPGTGKVSPVGFSIGNLGYVGTGSPTNTIGSETKEFWEYNPENDSWTPKAAFGGDSRDRAVGFSIGSKGYIGTGFSFNGSPNFYKDFWEYDPVSDSWTQKADFSGSGRTSAVGFSIGSKGYIGLGTGYQTDFWQYDSESDSWLEVARFTGEGRLGGKAFSIGNKGYVGTGYSVGSEGVLFYNDFWEYEGKTLTTNLDQQYLQKLVKVYPNPAINFINLSQNNVSIIETIVYDIHGKQQLKTSSNFIDISKFSVGIYYLKIKTSKGRLTKKIIKK